MNTAKEKDLYDKIPKFSGLKEDVQLEEVVRQIENFADLVQWVDNEDGENGAICYLFRELLIGKADQIWRMIEEEEEISTFGKTLKGSFKCISQPKLDQR